MSKRFEKARHYTALYKSYLAPCKYCGNTDIQISSDRGYPDPKYYWSVNCMTDNCDFTIDTSIRRAIAKWNSRHRKE